MMGEIVTRNMYSKAIAENKNAIVASCTYFTTMDFQFYLEVVVVLFCFIFMKNLSTNCVGLYVKISAFLISAMFVIIYEQTAFSVGL